MNAPLVTRSLVTSGKPYATYKSQLRTDFNFACAYCGRSEKEVTAKSFQIDHHFPTCSDPSNEYPNLYWACESCNREKSDFVPEPFTQAERVVRIDLEHPAKHLGGDVTLTSLTRVGEVHIAVFFLDARFHVHARETRKKLYDSVAVTAHGLRTLKNLRTDLLTHSQKTELLAIKNGFRKNFQTVECFLEDMGRSLNQDGATTKERKLHTSKLLTLGIRTSKYKKRKGKKKHR